MGWLQKEGEFRLEHTISSEFTGCIRRAALKCPGEALKRTSVMPPEQTKPLEGSCDPHSKASKKSGLSSLGDHRSLVAEIGRPAPPRAQQKPKVSRAAVETHKLGTASWLPSGQKHLAIGRDESSSRLEKPIACESTTWRSVQAQVRLFGFGPKREAQLISC